MVGQCTVDDSFEWQIAQKILYSKLEASPANTSLYNESTWLSDFVFTFLATNFVCNQCKFVLMDFMVWDSYFVFNPKDSRSKIYVEVYDGIVLILNLETHCSSSAALQIQWWVPTVLFFFWDFFWRSGLLEYWIQLYALWPGTQLNSPCKLASSVFSWSLTLPV